MRDISLAMLIGGLEGIKKKLKFFRARVYDLNNEYCCDSYYICNDKHKRCVEFDEEYVLVQLVGPVYQEIAEDGYRRVNDEYNEYLEEDDDFLDKIPIGKLIRAIEVL